MGISSLREFREWTQSPGFPDRGRIDYVRGDIEVDMSPENMFFHGTLKTKLTARILDRVEELELGHVCSDRMRITSVSADLSAEPGVIVVSQRAIDEGRVRLVPAASQEADSFVEIEGGPDIVVEIVSENSVHKDRFRLPQAFYLANVQEYWLADARGEQLEFQIYARGDDQFVPVDTDDNGFQPSAVLQAKCRLIRSRGIGGFWRYELDFA